MILPIYVFGEPILREETEEVTADSAALQQLIDDMIDTMRGAGGVGLAAPQVGRRERLFVVDLSPMADDVAPDVPTGPMAFINPEIVWEGDDVVEYEEGCLSIPDLRDVVARPERVRLRYLDRAFTPREQEVDGWLARVVQHEYDHLEGILFIDRISPFRRRMLRRRLREMARGDVEAEYPVVAGTHAR